MVEPSVSGPGPVAPAAERPRVAERPVAASADGQRRPLEDRLDELLGERLMPLRVRTRAGQPYLLAVDASGHPVVVEVVPVLDEVSLATALGYAGQAARMSTRDLAAAYSGGAGRFAAHLAAFRLTVPTTALLPTLVRGARLIVVCSVIAEQVADALEFLVQPGRHVEVLRVEVRSDPAGGRVAELIPVEPGPLPDRAEGRPERGWADDGAAAQPPDATLPGATPPPTSPRASSQPRTSQPRTSEPRTSQPGTSQPGPEPTIGGAAADRHRRPSVRPPSFAVPIQVRLSAIAAGHGGPTPLVWPWRPGQTFHAVLHLDGTLELPDGSRHHDPGSAARAVSRASGWIDGWHVWRVGGADGPPLAEAELHQP